MASNPNSNDKIFTSGILSSISSRGFIPPNRWILSKSRLFQSISSGGDRVDFVRFDDYDLLTGDGVE
ncbi:hypothetical protein L1987_57376 [Smallanthus sonchifolius]|uniref:Uncharacterized protein n=1 Tax=Smallanthus sonchifolius TaxID=185202 RepID=A0ACB9DCU3_9ASTR|nr:hypothetical protein L1987_57376 [Smallanthus sonchifolius]